MTVGRRRAPRASQIEVVGAGTAWPRWMPSNTPMTAKIGPSSAAQAVDPGDDRDRAPSGTGGSGGRASTQDLVRRELGRRGRAIATSVRPRRGARIGPSLGATRRQARRSGRTGRAATARDLGRVRRRPRQRPRDRRRPAAAGPPAAPGRPRPPRPDVVERRRGVDRERARWPSGRSAPRYARATRRPRRGRGRAPGRRSPPEQRDVDDGDRPRRSRSRPSHEISRRLDRHALARRARPYSRRRAIAYARAARRP